MIWGILGAHSPKVVLPEELSRIAKLPLRHVQGTCFWLLWWALYGGAEVHEGTGRMLILYAAGVLRCLTCFFLGPS